MSSARVLGLAQDAGVPHPGCACPRCEAHRARPLRRACLGLVDDAGGGHLVDATPDLASQLHDLGAPLRSILLTHAHVGHYLGLAFLGPEGGNVRDVTLHATPRTCEFLARNAPWELLVRRGVLRLSPAAPDSPIALGEGLFAEPVVVPHRAEYTDTVGFYCSGTRRRILYCPDADRFEDLPGLLARCDEAWLDGTFFSAGELGPGRPAVPHPPIRETLLGLGDALAPKVRFLHFNHTNPVLDASSPERAFVERAGARLARDGEEIPL